MDIFGTIKGAINCVKFILAASNELKAAELNLQLAKTLILLGDAEAKAFDLTRENTRLREDLDAAQAIKDAVVVPSCGLLQINGSGPFCPKCWSLNNLKSFIVSGTDDLRLVEGKNFECPVCRGTYV